MVIMRIDPEPTDDIIKRLRRVEGQIRGLIRMLEDGRDCADIVTQVAAARRALDRAGFKLLSSGLRQCLDGSAAGAEQNLTPAEMEKLFLSLA